MPRNDRDRAKALHKNLAPLVTYAPWWVRILSAVALALGTMIGYKRIVTTLGERLGKQHLVPAQGAAAEVVAAGLIGGAVLGAAGVTVLVLDLDRATPTSPAGGAPRDAARHPPLQLGVRVDWGGAVVHGIF